MASNNNGDPTPHIHPEGLGAALEDAIERMPSVWHLCGAGSSLVEPDEHPMAEIAMGLWGSRVLLQGLLETLDELRDCVMSAPGFAELVLEKTDELPE